jgi:hypothetical protein
MLLFIRVIELMIMILGTIEDRVISVTNIRNFARARKNVSA